MSTPLPPAFEPPEPVDPALAEPPTLAPLGLAHLAEYVIGFPVHVAVTFRASPPAASLKQLVLPTFASIAGSLGVLLRDASGALAVDVDPTPVAEPDLGAFLTTLGSNEERRVLVDLSPAMPWSSMKPGRYELAVSYRRRGERVMSETVSVAFREPSGGERAELDDLRAELFRAGSWSEWSLLRASDEASLQGPFDASDPLRYCRVLRLLSCGAEELSALNPALLDVLTDLYSPEREALRAELLRAGGDAAASSAQIDRVKRDWPGLSSWMADVETDQSDLALLNEARRAARRTP